MKSNPRLKPCLDGSCFGMRGPDGFCSICEEPVLLTPPLGPGAVRTMKSEERRALLKLMYEVIIYARSGTSSLMHKDVKDDPEKVEKLARELNRLMYLIHNLPDVILSPELWNADEQRSYFEAHDACWSSHWTERYEEVLNEDASQIFSGGKEWRLTDEYRWGTRHGLSNNWYEDGQQSQQRTYHTGHLDGASKSWYRDGTQRSESHFLRGVQHGPHHSWHKNGQVACEGEWHHGTMHGTWTYWDEEGQQVRLEVFDQGQRVVK